VNWRINIALLVSVFVLQFVGASAQLSFSFSADSLNLGDVFPCSAARDSFWVTNAGVYIIPSPAVSNVSGFTVTADSPANIVPGERRKLYVEFNGNISRPFYRTPYIMTIRVSNQTASDTIWLIARRLPGNCCVFVIDTVKGAAGEPASIVVRQDRTSPGVNITGIELAMELLYNPTVLVPRSYPSQVTMKNVGSVSFRVPLLNSDGILFEMPCTITLGNEDSSRLGPKWFGVTDGNVTHETYSSKCIVTGVCLKPIARLFDPTKALQRVSVSANSHSINVRFTGNSYSPSVVAIYSVTGGKVDEAVVNSPGNSAEYSTRDLPSGLYLVMIDGYSSDPVVVLP